MVVSIGLLENILWRGNGNPGAESRKIKMYRRAHLSEMWSGALNKSVGKGEA